MTLNLTYFRVTNEHNELMKAKQSQCGMNTVPLQGTLVVFLNESID